MQGFPIELDVLQVTHYEMNDNKGIAIHYIAGAETTNNKFGCAVVEGIVKDYSELNYLKQFENQLPARFKAVAEFSQKKDKNNKSIGTLAFSRLEFVHELELTQKKVTAAK